MDSGFPLNSVEIKCEWWLECNCKQLQLLLDVLNPTVFHQLGASLDAPGKILVADEPWLAHLRPQRRREPSSASLRPCPFPASTLVAGEKAYLLLWHWLVFLAQIRQHNYVLLRTWVVQFPITPTGDTPQFSSEDAPSPSGSYRTWNSSSGRVSLLASWEDLTITWTKEDPSVSLKDK